jgi:hypothetical protein
LEVSLQETDEVRREAGFLEGKDGLGDAELSVNEVQITIFGDFSIRPSKSDG